jgi:hypothetical protein
METKEKEGLERILQVVTESNEIDNFLTNLLEGKLEESQIYEIGNLLLKYTKVGKTRDFKIGVARETLPPFTDGNLEDKSRYYLYSFDVYFNDTVSDTGVLAFNPIGKKYFNNISFRNKETLKAILLEKLTTLLPV